MTASAGLADTDRVALRDLVHRYAADVDDRDFAAVATLFTADAVLAMPEPPANLDPVSIHRGHDAVLSALSALDEVPLTFHGILGAVFDAGDEPGTAVGRIACAAHHLNPREDRAVDVVWHVRYRDRYVRTDLGWRFARRDAAIDFIDKNEPRRSRLA